MRVVTQWAIGGGAMWLVSLVARALPEPVPMGSRFYLFLYNLAHLAGANFEKMGVTPK